MNGIILASSGHALYPATLAINWQRIHVGHQVRLRDSGAADRPCHLSAAIELFF
jgi:hypothetical protein